MGLDIDEVGSDALKQRANDAFRNEEYDKAIELYTTAIDGLCNNPQSSTASQKLPVLLTNRAMSRIKVEKFNEAVEDCRRAICNSPLHGKAYYHLAVCLRNIKDLNWHKEAEIAISKAVALTPQQSGSTCVAREMFKEMTTKDAHKTVFAIKSSTDFLPAVKCNGAIAVVHTGSYNLPLPLTRDITILGLSPNVIIGAGYSHALYLVQGSVHLRNITFKYTGMGGSPSHSAVCVSESSGKLLLEDCTLHDYGEVGILVHGGYAQLKRCSIQKTLKQAVEVRQGGSVEIFDSTISNCMQGICAYGGARHVGIHDVSINDCSREGILASGAKKRAETRAQMEVVNPFPTGRNNVAMEADAWGATAGIDLDVVIVRSTISNNGMYGLSLDDGAQVCVYNCELKNNSPYAIFAKGQTNLSLTSSRIIYGSYEGVHVGINYGGLVQLMENCFAGKKKSKAILEEYFMDNKNLQSFGATKQHFSMLGWWSRPLDERGTRWFSKSNQMPQLSELSETAPLQTSTNFAGNSTTSNFDMVHMNRVVLDNGETEYQYYAIGNTFGYNMLDDRLTSDHDISGIVSVLLGACGDLRNLLKTVEQSSQSKQHISFVLNDKSMSILARNIVILELIASGATAVDVLAVWANHALSDAQRDLVDNVCHRLLDCKEFPIWLSFLQCDNDTIENFRTCLLAWASSTVELKVIKQMRSASIIEEVKDTSVILTMKNLPIRMKGGRYEQEVRNYISSGSLVEGPLYCQINPTLLRAPDMRYSLYWSSSVYRAIELKSVPTVSNPTTSIYSLLCATVAEQIAAVRDALVLSPRITIDIVHGDVLEHLSRKEHIYDVIDCSNVSDYVSLPCVLQACSMALKPVKHAYINIQSMQWEAVSVDEPLRFLDMVLGWPLAKYEELLGLFMASKRLGGEVGNRTLFMQWKWSKSAIIETGDVDRNSNAWMTDTMLLIDLLGAAKMHCGLLRGKSGNKGILRQRAGLDYNGAVTLVHLIALSHPNLANSLMSQLVCMSSEASLHDWEIRTSIKVMLQEWYQTEVNSLFSVFSFVVDVSFYRLKQKDGEALCLVISKKSLQCGFVVDKPQIMQIIDSFAFCRSSYRVSFMLLQSLVDGFSSSGNYVNLCSYSQSGELFALGESTCVNSITITPFLKSLSEMKNPVLIERELYLPKRTEHSGWSVGEVKQSSGYVTVDIGLPVVPFPCNSEAKLILELVSAYKVIWYVKRLKKAKYDAKLFEHEFEVSLPCAINTADSYLLKISRTNGLASVRIGIATHTP